MVQISDTANNTGLFQLCEQELFGDTGFGQITNDTARKQIFTNYFNEGNARYTRIAVDSCGKWVYDDSNQTDYPIVLNDLVSGQQDYQMSVSFVDILGVEVADSSGIFHGLTEVSEREYSNAGISITDAYRIPSQPYQYMKLANSIFLLPATNYNYAGGLKLRIQRPHVYFVYTDTVKVPGFNSDHHQYLVNFACWKYATSRSMPADRFQTEVLRYEQMEIPDFYSSRNKDKVKKLRTNRRVRR